MYCFGNLRPLVFWGILFGVRICLARHLMNKYSTALNIGYGPGGPYWGQQFQTMVACHLLEPLISTDTTQLIHANVLLHQGFDMTAKFWRPTSKFSVFSCMSFVLCSMFCLLSTLHRKIHVDPFFVVGASVQLSVQSYFAFLVGKALDEGRPATRARWTPIPPMLP